MAMSLVCHTLMKLEFPGVTDVTATFRKALLSLSKLQSNVRWAQTSGALISQVLGEKFKDTKRQRPIIIQQWQLLSRSVDIREAEGTGEKPHRQDLFEQVAADFNATQGDSDTMITRHELDGIKLLDDQSDSFRQRLRRHYDAYPVEHSAVP